MKVKIGPYKNWFGPYQFADLLQYLGFSQRTCDKIGEYIPEAPFVWLDKFKKRKIKIHIDKYDTWNMDHTLALIIHPMLIQLKATKHGYPMVDDEDIPQELLSSLDDEQKWDWVMDEMIHSFEAIVNNQDDFSISQEELKRIQNGLRLFGKYYQSLWD